MATGSRSLPTNSLVPYFQPIDREYMPESGLSDRYSPRATIVKGVCRSSHNGYATGLDDYDTLFEARHGREMIDIAPGVNAPMISTEVVPTTFGGIIPASPSTGMIVNPRTEIISTSGFPFQKKCIPMGADRVVSPSSSHIIGEDATVFTDMTDTMLKVLDQWMALTAQAWEPENSLAENALAAGQPRSQLTSYVKDSYPDLYPPVKGNFRISEVFYGYSDSLSLDNNPMVLVEWKDFAHQYGTPVYAVDRVNEKMYSTFEGGYKLISKRATLEPEFRITEWVYWCATFLCEYTAWNDQYRYSYCKVYPSDPDRPSTFHAHSYSSCTRHIRTIFKWTSLEQLIRKTDAKYG